MKERDIYLDHGATTPMWPQAVDAMLPYLTEQFANPAGIYRIADQNSRACELARKEIAAAIGAKAQEIYFTGGGTESDNWALIGFAFANRIQGNHIITTQIEHHAVLETAHFLETQGFRVTYLPVDHNGLVSAKDLQKALEPDTILVSIMHANNEIGSIQNISELAEVLHHAKRPSLDQTHSEEFFTPAFHTDAVQSLGHIPVDTGCLSCDLLSASAHKFGGPKGIGFLYIREGIHMTPLLHGGRQERMIRGGTLNVPGIIGMSVALKESLKNGLERSKRIRDLRDLLATQIIAQVSGVTINGVNPFGQETDRRLPNNLNLAIRGVRGENLVLFGNMDDLFFSTGSACTTGAADPSHVLLAIGKTEEEAFSSVRLTLGEDWEEEMIKEAAKRFAKTVQKVRQICG